MKDVAKRSFVVAIWLSAVLVFAAIAITVVIEVVRPTSAHLEAHKFELEIFKIVLAGFVVGMLGILIPAVVIEARHRFEQRKESRVAYSAAKTTIDYLKLRLATASLEEATTAVQQAHFNKHLAQLYDDLAEWIKRRYPAKLKMDPDKWDVLMYGRLFAARVVLENHANAWDTLSPAARIKLLDEALPTKSELDEVDTAAIGVAPRKN